MGVIARAQHIPVLSRHPAFELVATCDRRSGETGGTIQFTDHRRMLAALPELDAVAICTPPGVRASIAYDALSAGKHVLLEKPPTSTVNELEELAALACEKGPSLFAAWHSRYQLGLARFRNEVRHRALGRFEITWSEDVREWHPGQDWIWDRKGLGVFDAGINAFAMVTDLVDGPLGVIDCELTYPSNRQAPIAARLKLREVNSGAEITATFNWRWEGPPCWEIVSHDGAVRLTAGGRRLEIDGRLVVDAPPDEYRLIYNRFDELVSAGASEVDGEPLRLVSEAFSIARGRQVEPFFW